jgi:D-alanine-D-alanine ligase
MQDAVALAARYDPDVLCEEFIAGIELTCPVLGQGASARALPVVRIDAPDGNYDYHHKYFTDDTGYRCPSGLPAPKKPRCSASRWPPTARWAAAAGAAPT